MGRQTPSERLLYAIYLGSTPDEVRTSTKASFLFASASTFNRELWESVGNEWMNRDAYVWLSAIDPSGNMSARSEPVQVNAGDSGGCTIRGRWHRSSLSSIAVFAAMAISALRRRRSRRR